MYIDSSAKKNRVYKFGVYKLRIPAFYKLMTSLLQAVLHK